MTTTVRDELDLLCRRHNGVLHPEHVVEYARRHPTSALHKRFNWNIEEAAMQHWLQTARQLVAVHFEVIGDGLAASPHRMFFSPAPVDGGKPGGYVSTEEKLQHPDGRREIALRTLARMRGLYESYPLEELKPVVDAIDICIQLLALPSPDEDAICQLPSALS